jgi:hypothetical protein
MENIMTENAELFYNPENETNPKDDFQKIIDDVQKQLMGRPGIEGVGQGKTADGRDSIVVYAKNKQALSQIPESVRGYPVLAQVTGEFKIN